MGKRYFGQADAFDTHREWEDCTDHHEFKNEWYPWCRQTMRHARRGHALIWEEDYYLIRGWRCRFHHRCWKKYRRTQYRPVNM